MCSIALGQFKEEEMSEHNTENQRRKNKEKNKRKFNILKLLKIFVLMIFIVAIIGGGALGGIVLSMVKSSPEIDPSKINANLSHTSSILDLDGNLIEKIETAEFRTFVGINKIPKHVQEAFISIEDERFYDHPGIDIKGIAGSFLENFKADGIVRGASTITQQLVKNVYLSPDKKYSRKVQEAYLALKVDKALSKPQILEAYLNRNFFGQNAYGIQEAAQTYFSKDVDELTIAEAAVIAGIIKNIQDYQPYYRMHPENFDSEKHFEVGEADILGEKFILVFNENSVERQRIILKKMLELGSISQEEYDQALAEDIKENLKPGIKKTSDITSYFTDYVKKEVIKSLVDKVGYTRDQAEELVFAGGLQIYSTVDLKMQQELENVYENFTNVLSSRTSPFLISWSRDKVGNIKDENNKIVFYKQENLFNDDFDLIIEKGTFDVLDNGDLMIKSNKMTIYPKHIDIADYYRVDDKKNLITHTVGSIVIPEDEFSVTEKKELIISKKFLDKSDNFYSLDEKGNLIISQRFFFRSKDGIVQPQSATVVLDYRTGHIKALIGGRDVEGNMILNRATDSQRQPGSSIKPVATYLPALDNGYTAGSAMDDLPYFDKSGQLKPRNWNLRYTGIQSLRNAVEQSVNTISVRTVESIGVSKLKVYLERMGIINTNNPESDSFKTSEEDRARNDENTSALGLGGMTKGLTPLELTAAYGSIANDGVFVEPTPFTKVIDREGNVLLESTPKETIVVSPQVAYIMKDILHSTVTRGLSSRAKIPGMAVAGKTGTTQNAADIWFLGFTPYYVSGVWIGNDSPKIQLSTNSTTAAEFWRHIMTKAHEGLDKIPSFQRPGGIISVNVCSQSGLLPTELCQLDPRHVIRSEIFVKGTEPTSLCDIHVEAEIDVDTGLLANEFCPTENVETRVFIQRNPPYDPEKNKNLVPEDWEYSLPTKVCDKHDHTTIVEPEDPEDEPGNGGNNNGNNNNSGNNGNNGGNNNNGNGNNGDNGNDGNNESNNMDLFERMMIRVNDIIKTKVLP